jgi:hypothetical protein
MPPTFSQWPPLEIMDSVVVLQHLHILPTGEEDVKLLGVYRSFEGAHSAATEPRFRDHPGIVDRQQDSDEQGFHIGVYSLDMDHWSEGYVTS